MKQKSEFSILSRAIQTVDGFSRVYETLRQHTALQGKRKAIIPVNVLNVKQELCKG